MMLPCHTLVGQLEALIQAETVTAPAGFSAVRSVTASGAAGARAPAWDSGPWWVMPEKAASIYRNAG